jgi:hypothetical protein
MMEAQTGEMMQTEGDFNLLDRVLAQYGPDTKDGRNLLRAMVAQAVSENGALSVRRSATLNSGATQAGADSFLEKIQQLQPQNEYHRSLHVEAIVDFQRGARQNIVKCCTIKSGKEECDRGKLECDRTPLP